MKIKDFDFRLWHEQLSCFVSYANELNRIIPKNKNIEFELYSGFKDSERVKIYEGDIILNLEDNFKAVVSLKRGIFWLESEKDGDYMLAAIPQSMMKVIGNIHEHSELLKDK